MSLPDPLDSKDRIAEGWPPALRVLSDRGIRQAVDQGLLEIEPGLQEGDSRVQPVTFDVGFQEVGYSMDPVPGRSVSSFSSNNVAKAGRVSFVEFGDLINTRKALNEHGERYFGLMADGKSSLLRLGPLVGEVGRVQLGASGLGVNLANFSPNDLRFEKGERIAQLFVTCNPFGDKDPWFGDVPAYAGQGEQIRALDMGVQAQSTHQLESLERRGLMEIERPGKKAEYWDGLILLHAGKTAFKVRDIGGIDFSRRRELANGELFERVDISRGYSPELNEHLVVETEEKFKLSKHVGISVMDNFPDARVPGSTGGLESFSHGESLEERMQNFSFNMVLRSLRNSWIDPGYEGVMTRFPKLTNKVVRPGEVVGYGQAFYFPRGVERPYGSKELKNNYQKQNKFEVK